MLAQVSVRFQQDEWGVSGKNYGICGVPISSTAVVDNGVSIITTIWNLTTNYVPVVIIFVIPFYVSLCKTCVWLIDCTSKGFFQYHQRVIEIHTNLSLLGRFISYWSRHFKTLCFNSWYCNHYHYYYYHQSSSSSSSSSSSLSLSFAKLNLITRWNYVPMNLPWVRWLTFRKPVQ